MSSLSMTLLRLIRNLSGCIWNVWREFSDSPYCGLREIRVTYLDVCVGGHVDGGMLQRRRSEGKSVLLRGVSAIPLRVG